MRTRRQLLHSTITLAGLAGLAALPAAPAFAQLKRPRITRDPFTLGVASGYPNPDGFVLWTRLAPEPLAPDGGMPPLAVPLVAEIAADDAFRNIVRRIDTWSEPDWAHSVHLDVADLPHGREYWYRFRCGDALSPVGRTWTAPAAGSPRERLRIAVASCQQYEHGYYTAYARMVEDHPDLVVHVGDYIYEVSWGESRIRHHGAGECYTLSDYRLRHALYRLEPELQSAHRACPWMLTMDDHEVDNDWAGSLQEENDDPALFLARRAAAFRAYYEHLPLPRHAAPFGTDMRLYAARACGDLATLYMLDERQYRSPQACPRPGRAGSNRIEPDECAELSDASRTMLGAPQEAWLDARLEGSRTRWNVLAQGVVMAFVDEDPGPRQRFWTDSWNGYAPARERLMHSLARPQVRNPLVVSGDIHAFVAANLRERPGDAATRVIASELVTTSITSQATPRRVLEAYRDGNPDVLLADGTYRGYVRLDLTPRRLQADLVAMESVERCDATAARVLRSFVVEDGVPGLQPV